MYNLAERWEMWKGRTIGKRDTTPNVQISNILPLEKKQICLLLFSFASAFPVDVKADLLLWMMLNEDYGKNYQAQSGHNTDVTSREVLQAYRSISNALTFPYKHLSSNGITNELYQKRATNTDGACKRLCSVHENDFNEDEYAACLMDKCQG